MRSDGLGFRASLLQSNMEWENRPSADFPVRVKGGYIQSQASGVGRVKGRGFPFARTVFLRWEFPGLLYSEVYILGSPQIHGGFFRAHITWRMKWKRNLETTLGNWDDTVVHKD